MGRAMRQSMALYTIASSDMLLHDTIPVGRDLFARC